VYSLFLFLRPKAPLKDWFIGSLKGFFDPRQLPTAQSSPTQQRRTKSTKTTTTVVVVVNDGNLPSDDEDDEGSPSKPLGFSPTFRSPAKQKSKWKTRTNNNTLEIASERRGNSFVSPRRVGLGGEGGALKDAVVPVVLGATIYRHATTTYAPHQDGGFSVHGTAVGCRGYSAKIVRPLEQKVGTRIPKRIQHPKIKTADDIFFDLF